MKKIIIIISIVLCGVISRIMGSSQLNAFYEYNLYKINPNTFWAPQFFSENFDGGTYFKLTGYFDRRLAGMRVFCSPYILCLDDTKAYLGLREANIRFSLGSLDWTIGRIISQTGTGYIFTPSSIITPVKNLSDPEDVFQRNNGTDLIKADWYSENTNLSLIIFRKSRFENIALFGYTRIRNIDLYTTIARTENHDWEIGNAVSATFGKGLEVHADWIVKEIAPVKYSEIFFQNPVDSVYQTSILVTPERKLYPQFIAGINLTTTHWNWIAEYYYQGWGFNYYDWKKIIQHQRYLLDNLFFKDINQDMNENILLVRQFPMGCMKHYFFSRWIFNNANVPFSVISFTNLQDFSSIIIFQLDFSLKNKLHMFIRPLFFLGKSGSEYGENYYSHILELGLQWSY